MKKSLIAISALLAVALVATSAFSWSPGRGCRGGGMDQGGGFDTTAWNDLSPEKRDQLTALRQKFIDETYETRSAMMAKHQEIRMLMETSSPDRTKLKTLSQEITELRHQMFSNGIDFQLEAKKIAPELHLAGKAGCGKERGGMGRCGKTRGDWDCPVQSSGSDQ